MGRRTYSREFKISAVGLVQQQGYTVVHAAKSLGIDPASILPLGPTILAL